MITIRSAQDRGAANLGWLDSKHTFSFGSYHDPEYMGFGNLRVINEDKIQPGKGFATHGHRDMEIISYVLAGELKHQDSIGNGSIIRPGDVQRMSAGTGILHSEFNASKTDPVHLLQIWIMPDTAGIEPSYEQKNFALETQQSKLKLVGSRDGSDNSVTIHQDVNLYLASLGENETIEYDVRDHRLIWIQVTRGSIKIKEQILDAGDGAAISQESQIVISGATDKTEVLLFDLG